MAEKYFIWDNCQNGLVLLGGTEKQDKKIKHRKRRISIVNQSKIYCPHADLILNFTDIFNPSQKIKFRKYYLRKVSPDDPDVITIQDIKNLVMYSLTKSVSVEFINFFHLRVVDRFLRALIMYFQSYTEIWEELMKKRIAILTKAPNPLAKNYELIRTDQMRTLRFILVREYCELLVGCDETAKYHHMMGGKHSMFVVSHSVKDLRIFESLISVAHRVVWIALQRKYFTLIEIELHRLFRTDAYNIANRKSGMINQTLLEEEMRILHGPKIPSRPKLLKISPLIYQLFSELCDFRIVSLGLINFESEDPRINYLKNSLTACEDKLSQLGIKVGILGHPRVNYDTMLVPIEDEKTLNDETIESWERRKCSLLEKSKKSNASSENKFTSMPAYGPESEFPDAFPFGVVKYEWNKYDESREEAKKKWISRELDR